MEIKSLESKQKLLIVLGQLLREHRQFKKLTLKNVGEYMSLSHTVIANVEHGKRRLDVGEFVAYCQYLELKPTWLLDQALTKLNVQQRRIKKL